MSADLRLAEGYPRLFQVVSFEDWWNGVRTTSSRRLPLVDVRSADSHTARRIALHNGCIPSSGDDSAKIVHGSCTTGLNASVVVHLPFETLLTGERSCELPPRHVEFAVLTDDRDVPRDKLEAFFGATVSKATQQSRKPWRVVQLLVTNEELWLCAGKHGVFEEGTQQQQQHGTAEIRKGSFVPFPRLWEPDPLVKNMLLPLVKESLQHTSSLEIWDLGSGAGRDVCFLAEELKRFLSLPLTTTATTAGIDCLESIKIVGVDNHKASAKRCIPFWKHRHVGDITEALFLNLNKIDLVRNEIRNRSCGSRSNVACYYAVRFWNRKLINFLINEEASQEGTLLAMSHFCKPYEGATWNFDHPKVCQKL